MRADTKIMKAVMRNTSQNSQSLIDSSLEYVPQENTMEHKTEYFIKFPIRFFKSEWFAKPNHLNVFMYLLSKINYMTTTIIFKDKRCIIAPWECIITVREIAEKLNISKSEIKRILDYFTNIYEIGTLKTSVFTLVTITYLAKDYKSGTRMGHEWDTKKGKYYILREVIIGLDNKDKYNNNKDFVNKIQLENKQSSVGVMDKTTLLNEMEQQNSVTNSDDVLHNNYLEKQEPVTNNGNDLAVGYKLHQDTNTMNLLAKPKANVQQQNTVTEKLLRQPNIVNNLYLIYKEVHEINRGIKYEDVSKGKDLKIMKTLHTIYLTKYPQASVEQEMEHFRTLFTFAYNLNDPWYHDNMTPSFFFSQYNKILVKIIGSKIQTNLNGFNNSTQPDYTAIPENQKNKEIKIIK